MVKSALPGGGGGGRSTNNPRHTKLVGSGRCFETDVRVYEAYKNVSIEFFLTNDESGDRSPTNHTVLRCSRSALLTSTLRFCFACRRTGLIGASPPCITHNNNLLFSNDTAVSNNNSVWFWFFHVYQKGWCVSYEASAVDIGEGERDPEDYILLNVSTPTIAQTHKAKTCVYVRVISCGAYKIDGAKAGEGGVDNNKQQRQQQHGPTPTTTMIRRVVVASGIAV